MIAVGCLLPFLLVVAGAILGGTHGGAENSAIGAGIGLVIGMAVPALAFLVFSRMRRKPPPHEGGEGED